MRVVRHEIIVSHAINSMRLHVMEAHNNMYENSINTPLKGFQRCRWYNAL